MCNCKDLKTNDPLPRNIDTTVLRECVEEEYEVIGVKVGVILWRGYTVDLSQICCKQAQKLIDEGFNYLRKKEVVENENPTTDTGSSATVELPKSTRNSKKNKAE
ncbi:hypothetical protein V9L05_01370 [Bernardetia sp. Wsw4-3y2]|uniref:hypothetical protein n=1 Tax=Bernardetia sp. Wsw4-3y2 TaxID=3127471 RepID=UPI0030D5FA91